MTIIDNHTQNYLTKTFEGLDLMDSKFSNLVFEQCEFKKCNFTATTFIHCKFVDCAFEKCNLTTLKVNQSSFSEVVFDECKMLGIDWTVAAWPGVILSSPIKFYGCQLSQSNFFGLNLNEIVFESCQMHDCDFREAELNHAIFWHSDLLQTLFLHTNLRHADFNDAINYTIDLQENDIKKAKFSFPEVVHLLDHLDIDISGLDIS